MTDSFEGVLIWLIIAVVVVAGLFLMVIRLAEAPKSLNKVFYVNHWRRIEVFLSNASQYQLAVLEADKLLDRAFKDRGFRGQTMGERLVVAGKYLSHKDEVWQVHKLRNRLVHEMDITLTLEQSQRVLKIFRQALKDIGAL